MMSTANTQSDSWLRRSPLDLIEHEHLIQAQLCDSLERIADDLPDNVDRRLCLKVIDSLQNEMPLHHRDEELGLFPLIEKRAVPDDNIHEILARLALEHATDESFASELLEKPRGPERRPEPEESRHGRLYAAQLFRKLSQAYPLGKRDRAALGARAPDP